MSGCSGELSLKVFNRNMAVLPARILAALLRAELGVSSQLDLALAFIPASPARMALRDYVRKARGSTSPRTGQSCIMWTLEQSNLCKKCHVFCPQVSSVDIQHADLLFVLLNSHGHISQLPHQRPVAHLQLAKLLQTIRIVQIGEY